MKQQQNTRRRRDIFGEVQTRGLPLTKSQFENNGRIQQEEKRLNNTCRNFNGQIRRKQQNAPQQQDQTIQYILAQLQDIKQENRELKARIPSKRQQAEEICEEIPDLKDVKEPDNEIKIVLLGLELDRLHHIIDIYAQNEEATKLTTNTRIHELEQGNDLQMLTLQEQLKQSQKQIKNLNLQLDQSESDKKSLIIEITKKEHQMAQQLSTASQQSLQKLQESEHRAKQACTQSTNLTAKLATQEKELQEFRLTHQKMELLESQVLGILKENDEIKSENAILTANLAKSSQNQEGLTNGLRNKNIDQERYIKKLQSQLSQFQRQDKQFFFKAKEFDKRIKRKDEEIFQLKGESKQLKGDNQIMQDKMFQEDQLLDQKIQQLESKVKDLILDNENLRFQLNEQGTQCLSENIVKQIDDLQTTQRISQQDLSYNNIAPSHFMKEKDQNIYRQQDYSRPYQTNENYK